MTRFETFPRTVTHVFLAFLPQSSNGGVALEETPPPALLIDAEQWPLLKLFPSFIFHWSAWISYQTHTSHSTFTVKPGEILLKTKDKYNFKAIKLALFCRLRCLPIKVSFRTFARSLSHRVLSRISCRSFQIFVIFRIFPRNSPRRVGWGTRFLVDLL